MCHMRMRQSWWCWCDREADAVKIISLETQRLIPSPTSILSIHASSPPDKAAHLKGVLAGGRRVDSPPLIVA